MEFESYADIIDAFERDDMGYETVTDYINGENIKIKEIEMVEKANGGLTTMGYENGGGIGSMMQPKKKKNKTKKPALQGGVDNYLGKQPQVVAPRTWQSSPDKPATELAYITKAEKDLIIKENIHGGLEGGPNMGPSGIMSLDSFGDVGGAGASGGDTDTGGGASQGPGTGGGGFSGRNTNTTSARDFDRQNANQRAALQIAERAQANRLGYDERQNITGIDRSNPNYNRSGIFGGKFNPLSLIAGLVGGPLAGLFTRGIMGLKNKFNDVTNNPDDLSLRERLTGYKTQADYEKARADRQVASRRDKLQDRIDKGYNSIFGMKTGDITDNQKATLANLNTQTGVSNAVIGGDPTSSRFKNFSPRVGNTNSMPNVNITDSSNITGGMAPNDYDVGNLGINNNDYGIGNPGQYATADMINEFGDGRMGNINDEFGYSPEFQAGLTNEFGESPEFQTGLINEFAENNVLAGNADQGFVNNPYGTSDQGFVNNPYGTSDQGFVNNPYGTPDQGFVNNPYGTPDQGFQGIGETIASITNNQLPGNNLMADISNLDVKAYMDNKTMFENLDSDTVSSIISDKTGNKTLTSGDVDVIKKYENNTRPTGQFAVARNGGIMGYGRG